MIAPNLFNRIKFKSKINQWKNKRYNYSQQHQYGNRFNDKQNEDVIEFGYPKEENSKISTFKVNVFGYNNE